MQRPWSWGEAAQVQDAAMVLSRERSVAEVRFCARWQKRAWEQDAGRARNAALRETHFLMAHVRAFPGVSQGERVHLMQCAIGLLLVAWIRWL
ncbi:MAG: hypothetical protein WC659_02725 [Patescibacteria group bacterium]